MSNPMRVLIGYDGSESSDQALEDLKKAGLPRRVDAVVMTGAETSIYGFDETAVATVGPLPLMVRQAAQSAKNVRDNVIDHAQEMARKGAERLSEAFPLWNVQIDVPLGSAAWAIVRKAEEWNADLIVVGAGGYSSLGRLIGSVSQLVLTHAPCSVRVARARSSRHPRELRILAGIDGSADCENALRAIEAREWPENTHLRLVYSIHHGIASIRIPHLIPPDIRIAPEATAQRRAAIRLAEEFATRMRSRLPMTTTFVEEGNPKNVLVQEAEEWSADCVFVGARGLSAARRFLLGSVSMAVAARAGCSVEVAR